MIPDEHFRPTEEILCPPDFHPNNIRNLLKKSQDKEGFEVFLSGQFISEEAREKAIDALVYHAKNNDVYLLETWRLVSKDECDETLVSAIEKERNEDLETLHIAAKLFESTYLLWSLGPDEVFEESETNINKVARIIQLARELSKYTVTATHMIRYRSDLDIGDIVKNNYITASNAEKQFEGSGVYAGILGGYRYWATEGAGLKFKIPLAVTFPIITDRNDPEAMVAILGNGIVLEGEDINHKKAVVKGPPHWNSYNYLTEGESKIAILSKLLGCEVNLIEDQYGDGLLIVDTKEPPIVWASAARALKFGNVATPELMLADYNEASI
jgi:hypothetical protein